MSIQRKWRTALVASALLALGLATGCGSGGKDGGEGEGNSEQDTAVPVEAALTRRDKVVASYTGTASLEPESQAQVVAKASGVVQRIMVEEGDHVTAGKVLATLDPDRAQLSLRQSAANLKRLENDARRASEMYGRKLLSAEANDRARFELENQKAAYDMARLELSYTRIVAPISGVVSLRMVKPGNLLQINQAAFMIDDFDPLLAVLSVPERELRLLQAGMPVSMQVDALPGRSFDGEVARISPVVDAQTGTFRVTAEFHDKTGTLKSGMFGRLTVVYDTRRDALVVPREALADEDGETFVYVVEMDPNPPKAKEPEKKKGLFGFGSAQAKDADDAKGKDSKSIKPTKPKGPSLIAKRKLVKTGYMSGNVVEIESGIGEGARVVTVGRAAVRDGTRILVIEGLK